MPTIGWFRGTPPIEPWKGRPPKANTPPSEATVQYAGTDWEDVSAACRTRGRASPELAGVADVTMAARISVATTAKRSAALTARRTELAPAGKWGSAAMALCAESECEAGRGSERPIAATSTADGQRAPSAPVTRNARLRELDCHFPRPRVTKAITVVVAPLTCTYASNRGRVEVAVPVGRRLRCAASPRRETPSRWPGGR